MRAAARSVAALFLVGCTALAGSGRTAEDDPGLCSNSLDDDFDGFVDCADPDCLGVDRCEIRSVDELPAPNLGATCANGWVLEDPEHDLCVPWAVGGRLDCGDGRQLPGTQECAPVGEGTCRLPGALFEDTFYVRADAAGGGDGSLDSPFGSLEEALATVPDGAELLLDGSFASLPVLDRLVHLRGVCPDRATLAGGLRVRAPGLHIAGISLRAAGEDALTIEPLGADAAPVRVESAVIEGTVRIEGALQIEGSRVRGPIAAEGGGSARIVETAIDGSPDAPCVSARDDAYARFRDVAFLGCPGGAVEVADRAHVVVEHSLFDELEAAGVEVACEEPPIVGDSPPCLELRATVLDRAMDNGAPALRLVRGRAILEATQVDFGVGRLVIVEGGELELVDTILNATRTAEELGILLTVDGGRVRAQRALARSAGSLGLDVVRGSFSGTDFGVKDVLVGTRRIGGIRAASGSELTLGGFYVQRADPCAVVLEADVTFGFSRGIIDKTIAAICAPEGAYTAADIYGGASVGLTEDVGTPFRNL